MIKKTCWLMVVLLVLALMLAGCGETITPEKVDTEPEETEEPQEEQEPQQEIFAVGDTVKMGDLQFTLNGVRFDKGDEYWQPDEGMKWIVFDCTIENNGTEATNISSMLMFSLYDSGSYSQSQSIGPDLKGSLDGEIGAGRKMSGEIAFEVEEGETDWEFIFEPNVFGFGQAIYKVSESDVK